MTDYGKNSISRFFILTFLITWIPWFTAVLSGCSVKTPAGIILVALGGIGPGAAAVITVFVYGTGVMRNDYLHRLRPGIIPGKWYGIILLIPPLLSAVAVFISIPFGGTLDQLMIPESFIINPLTLISFAIFVLFFGPVTEELGWRGFAQDALSREYNGITASLFIAAAWGLWHVPLFFIQGYPLKEMNMTTLQAVLYFSEFLPKSILYTWIFHKTGRSILSAILFHFMCNYTGMIIEIGETASLIQTFLFYGLAIAAVFMNKWIFLDSKIQDN